MMTVAEAVRRFEGALGELGYSGATQAVYRAAARDFEGWLGSGAAEPVTAVRRADIERYQAHLATTGLSRSTQAIRVRAVKRLFEWCEARGMVFEAPTRGIVETPAETRARPQAASDEELARLLGALDASTAPGIRNRAIVHVLAETGVRRGELTALRLEDLSIDEGLLRVRGSSPRVVAMGPEARHWLERYLREARPALAARGRPTRALFLGTRNGIRLEPAGLTQMLREASQRAGLETTIRCQMLRNHFAARKLAAGTSLRALGTLLGHRDRWVTGATYGRGLAGRDEVPR